MELADYKGKVSKCHCSNADPETPMPCNDCFCRGYVAQCLGCVGTGQKEEPVAGGNGVMKSTCPICGGKGKMAANKPADWDALHPPTPEGDSLEDASDAETESEEELDEELTPVA